MSGNEDLRQFLQTRRSRLRPEDVGLPPGAGPRRVAGLRREEVAMLASVSVDYYSRLEQGKTVNPSREVLDAIARALELDPDERAHLFDLAKRVHVPSRPPSPARQRVRTSVVTMIDALDTPAFVLGRGMAVLASNQMTRALLCDFEQLPRSERNMARWFFLDPSTRELYPDWETIARENVATLRMDAGRHPDDGQLSALIGELTVKSPDFSTWWNEHDVLRRSHGVKRYEHPTVGGLTVFYEALVLPDDPEQTLFIYTVEPGSPSEDALRLLASWSAPEADLPVAGQHEG